MKEIRHITCGIFYCRDSAEINGCGSLQTSLRFDSDVLRSRQQKHTANPLPAMLDDSTITTHCKIIGGLSTTRLRADFDLNLKCSASINFLPVDSPSLTFRKYHGQTII